MTAVFVSTLIAFVLLIVLIIAVVVVLFGTFVAILAREGDRPVELSLRSAAIVATTLGVLVGSASLVMLVEAARP